MAWVQNGAPTNTSHAGSMMTNANPAANAVAPNVRTAGGGSWKPATPRAWDAGGGLFGGGAPVATFTNAELAFRGDHRSYNQVTTAGGLWSWNFKRTNNVGPNAHDPNVHQVSGGNTRLVSFTRDIAVAKGFAGPSGYVYLARVNVGIDYNAFVGGNAQQAEVMAEQGVALRDIYAVRVQATGMIMTNSDFQVNNIAPGSLAAALVVLRS